MPRQKRKKPADTTYKIKHDIETGEYIVRCYVKGRYSEGRTYYTNDKQDALATMAAMMRRDAQNNG